MFWGIYEESYFLREFNFSWPHHITHPVVTVKESGCDSNHAERLINHVSSKTHHITQVYLALLDSRYRFDGLRTRYRILFINSQVSVNQAKLFTKCHSGYNPVVMRNLTLFSWCTSLYQRRSIWESFREWQITEEDMQLSCHPYNRHIFL